MVTRSRLAKDILWAPQAKPQLRSVDQATALRILRAIHRLITTGEGDVIRLQGIDPPEFRLRVGDYRVRFQNTDRCFEILSIRHRRDAYR